MMMSYCVILEHCLMCVAELCEMLLLLHIMQPTDVKISFNSENISVCLRSCALLFYNSFNFVAWER